MLSNSRETKITASARSASTRASAGILLATATLFLCAPGLLLGVQRQVLSGHVPSAAAALLPVGQLPEDRRLNLSIGLPLRNRSALDSLLADLYDPTSPRYHQYLTPDQFAAAFGPTESDYEALIAFVEANGLQVTARHSNRVLLGVSGAVADIEKAFHLTLRTYSHPTEARTFFAPDTEPSLDLSVPVLDISGLSDFELPRPASLRRLPVDEGADGGVPAGGSGPGGLYRGNDFRHAYAPGVSLNGAGQFVGLLEFDYYYPADIAQYRTETGILNVPLIDVFLDGAPAVAGGNNIEVALDIEVAMAMAPGLSAVIVYDGGSGGVGNDILNRMATDNLAKQLSASWTFPCNATTDQILQQFAAQGQAYFNASGDGGANTGVLRPPTDRPFVISVGGTTLTSAGTGGAWVSETSWNWNSTGGGTNGTGGGVSTVYTIPSWQVGIASMATNGGSITMRNVPDVAMIADAIYVVYNNGLTTSVGGTSASSPLWAAYAAIINQQAVSFGQPPVGFINPAVYALGNGPGYLTNFHDITTGNNTNAANPTKFFATATYDLCTGWGSPVGPATINALAPRINARVVTNASSSILVEGCSPANSVIDPGETVTVNFSLKNIGAVKVTNLVATLQADSNVSSPSSPQTYGALNSGGSAVSRSFSFTANGTCGGTLTATLQLQDGSDNLGTLPFYFPLGKPVTNLTQNFDSVVAPALPSGWTTLATTGGVAWVTATNLRDSSPNSAFVAEPTTAGVSSLISPILSITSASAQVAFRQNFNFEMDPAVLSNAFDGGVLEIKIGAGSFTDILAAGGSFLTNGYNRSVSPTNTDNPLFGRQVWGALSGGFITTIANLPSSAAGQSVQLRWRFGTDNGNAFGGTGWYVDSIAVYDGYSCCSGSPPVITLSPTNLIVPQGSNAIFLVTASGTPAPTYQWLFNGSNIPGATNTSLSITNAQATNIGDYKAIASNTVNSATSSAAHLTVLIAPPIQVSSVGGPGTNVAISVDSVTGLTYQLQYKDAFEDPVWLPIQPPVAGSGGPIILLDTNSPPAPKRFYRVTTF
jgi:hypothetical protein